ncbi:BON domain-containing protein [Pendulispora albinea]|uniref:BON domain-containing protein n=1 Tax=Pendulispora albinea TaxID=2741071 RepID=A0ABZ2LVF7_9BACT
MHKADESLARRVRDTLRQHGDLRSNEVLVAAENGVVTLEGWVDDIWIGAAIEKFAANIPGVLRVDSQLKVRTELGAEAQAKQTEFGTAKRARAITGRGL